MALLGPTGGVAHTARPPLLANKEYDQASIFDPHNLLREARRQKGLPVEAVPTMCVLDPDGDLVRHLRRAARARLSPGWACYHTDLYEFDLDGRSVGIVGCAVGGPFAARRFRRGRPHPR